MFRLESFRVARDRHDELLRDAERARRARVNRPEHENSVRRLRLPALRPLISLRQA